MEFNAERAPLRRRLAEALDVGLAVRPGLSWLNRLVVFVICLSTLLVVLETEPLIYIEHRALFERFEIAFLAFFSVEYVARVWVSVENPHNRGRLSYMLRPITLLDLLVILSMAVGLAGLEGAILRLLRLVRLLRVAKLGAYSKAMHNIGNAVAARRFELAVSLGVGFGLLMISASALYVLEGGAQPDSFGSIPRAMWWAMATLTTVGYGDVVPITAAGRFFAMLTALTGVGLIAMPAGILASAFSDAIQRGKDQE